MVEGFKLYRQFSKLRDTIGEVKLAWFTTFNLDISFFEKFLLSKLAQVDYESMKTIKDYEALNDTLFTEEINEKAVDIRVFYDFRAIHLKEIKKTCVPTIGVDPSIFGEKFKGGVFHPKVTLLVNNKNEGFLIVGSANLSFGGWARNSESILVKKIEDRENANRATNFFLKLINDKPGEELLREINKIWQQNLEKEADWLFVDSFQEKGLIETISVDEKSLHVWSPYFSNDIETVVSKQFASASTISIIPDINEMGQIRIEEGVLDTLHNEKRIKILRDARYVDFDTKPMVHAKVWLTPDKLAIGSWNFTSAGLNLNKQTNNIEAGIVSEISEQEFSNILSGCGLETRDDNSGMTQNDLMNERQDLLSDWKVSANIYADWKTFEYYGDPVEGISRGQYFLKLPGISKKLDLYEMQGQRYSFYEYHKDFLKDKLFNIYDGNDECVFIGVIIELNIESRPALGFDSMEDYLQAWLDGDPQKNKNNLEMQFSIDEESGEEIIEEIKEKLSGDYSNAWFTMFLSMGMLKKRVEEASLNQKEMKLLGYHIPGSITQLSDHLNLLNEQYEKGEASNSKAYIWFLINEGNEVIRLFNDLKGRIGQSIKRVSNINLQFEKKLKSKGSKWLEKIHKECNYE